MGVVHIRAAYAITVGSPGAKAVLLCFADRACDECGLAWPGMAYLSERTEIGVNRTREHVKQLVSGGFLAVHAYAKGGRGVSTEYVVLPHVAKLSTAPCGKCRGMKKSPPPGVGFSTGGKSIPSRSEPKTLPPGITPSIKNHYPSATPEGNPGGEPAGSRGLVGADSQGPPTVPTEALTILRGLGIVDGPAEPRSE